MDREILSFFMMCGSQYLFISPLRTRGTLLKWRRTAIKKAFFVLTYYEYRSVTIFHRQFRTKSGKPLPTDYSVEGCMHGCMESIVRSSEAEEQAEQVRQAFVRNPIK